MNPITIRGHRIQKLANHIYKIDVLDKICYGYIVKVLPQGVMCNCREFWDTGACKHATWIYNMTYVVDTNPESLLHAQYKDYLGQLSDGSKEWDYAVRVDSLDEITAENRFSVWGKYFCRHTGIFLLIEVPKPKEGKC